MLGLPGVGFAFVGPAVVGFAGVGFADEADSAVLVSGRVANSGLGVGEAMVADVAPLLSVDVVDDVADVDWLRARGEKQTRMAVASIKRLIVVESLPECHKIKPTIYIDKDASRTAGVNCPRKIRKSWWLPIAMRPAQASLDSTSDINQNVER